MTRLIDIECSECDYKEMDIWHTYGEKYGVCLECGAAMGRWHHSTGGVHGDDIPGGIYIPHAICHPDGTPRRFDSKSAIQKAAKEAGWTNVVEHVTPKGTDKSKHTTRWY